MFRSVSVSVLLACGLAFAAFAGGSSHVGFRTDGTGRYPEAAPVLEWAPDKNVVWKTPMPAGSNATPVISGGRLFTCADPTSLICLNVADGRILWRRSSNYDELGSEAEAAGIRETMAKAAPIAKELAQAEQKMNRARNRLRKNRDDAALKKELADCRSRVGELREKLKPFEEYSMPKTQRANGYTSATPVTDGRMVYAAFGTGAVVCFDMKGERKWGKVLEKPPHEWGSSVSPVLIGDTLLVQYDRVWALDAATGREKWKQKVPWKWGTPVHVNIAGTDVIFTCQGNALRVSDGKVLASRIHGRKGLNYNGPVLDGDTLYYIQGDAKAYDVPGTFAEELEVRTVWQATIKKDRYYGCPLIHDGLIYAITQGQVLTVLEQATGTKVYEKKLSMRKATVYPSITLGGKHLFISNERGDTIVIEPGREYKEVSQNRLEPFRCCPVFKGTRMYIRTRKHLYCIGK